MSRAEVFTFLRKMREVREKYEQDLNEIEKDYARRKGDPDRDAEDSGRDVALEAHARAYLLNHMLRELGWDISSSHTIVVEDPVDPVTGPEKANRRFLDYHGRDNARGRSLLIVESKRPNARLPHLDKGDVSTLIVHALEDIHAANLKAIKLSGEWREWIETLIDYAKRVKNQFGKTATRVLITNGEWFIIFKDVDDTLLSGKPSVGNILVFKTWDEVEARSVSFYTLLNYHTLSGFISPQHPSALGEFVSYGQEALCAHVVDVSYVRHGERQPVISVRVAVWVRTTKGAWVLFRKSYDEEFLLLSHDPDDLQKRSQKLARRAENLIIELNAIRPVRLITAVEFEKMAPSADFEELENELSGSKLIGKLDRDTFRLTIGEQFTFLEADTAYEACPFHFWGECHRAGDAVGDYPVGASSLDPRAFFPSGSSYHCAHQAVHNARKDLCILLAFEEYLCCRHCTFFSRCSPRMGETLPCQKDSSA